MAGIRASGLLRELIEQAFKDSRDAHTCAVEIVQQIEDKEDFVGLVEREINDGRRRGNATLERIASASQSTQTLERAAAQARHVAREHSRRTECRQTNLLLAVVDKYAGFLGKHYAWASIEGSKATFELLTLDQWRSRYQMLVTQKASLNSAITFTESVIKDLETHRAVTMGELLAAARA